MVQGHTSPHYWYLPPEFPLFEFADPPADTDPPARRSLVGFDDHIGVAPKRVLLGWRSDTRRVVAMTGVPRGGSRVAEDRRFYAVSLALSGAPWSPTFNTGPSSNAATHAAMDRIADRSDLWRHAHLDVDGTPQRAEVTAATPGVLVGCLPDAPFDFAFATAGIALPDAAFRLLAPDAAGEYELNPFQRATPQGLGAAEDRFWQ